MSLARSVHRLDIAAPSAALARRAGLLVEDALRTASLPGDGAELVLVRRLDLAVLDPRASPQGVALKLKSAWRALTPINGRDADDANLAAARAVRFADALEAHLTLSARLLDGRPARAWCWTLAVPGYRADAGVGAGLRSVVRSLAQLEEGPAALPHWFARVVAWGGIPRLLLALDADDAALILQRCPPSRPPTVVSTRETTAWQRAQTWAASTLARDDPRRALLESMAARLVWAPEAEDPARLTLRETGVVSQGTEPKSARTRPEAAENAPPATRAARTGAEKASPRRDRQGAGADAAGGTPATVARAAQSLQGPPAGTGVTAATTPALARGRGRAEIKDPGADRASAGHASARLVSPRAESVDSPAPTSPAPDNPDTAPLCRPAAPGDRPSAATAPDHAPGNAAARGLVAETDRAKAGPMSQAEHVRETQEAHPAPGAARPASGRLMLLHAFDAPTRAGGLLFLLPALEHVGLPAWLAAHPAERGTLPTAVLGALLRRLEVDDEDPAWELAFPTADAAALARAARWLAACRRHLRLAVGIGLASLCLRPAQLVITPTHAEVWLAFEQLDLRIRRAGLDIDPGWVPWFGRVVRFHYGRREP